MDQKSHLKVIAAGFTIIRFDDYPNIRIKKKDKDHHNWVTLEVFNTKSARERAFAELIKDPMIILDENWMENSSTQSAQTVYIKHPTASYAIFCFNPAGDLFVNSDWGFYGYAWRAFGNDGFKKFLSQCNAEYIVGKFCINYSDTTGKKIPTIREQNLKILVTEFIQLLKADLN